MPTDDEIRAGRDAGLLPRCARNVHGNHAGGNDHCACSCHQTRVFGLLDPPTSPPGPEQRM